MTRRSKPQTPSSERKLREDLVTQACLEAYGSIRHGGRMADRALEFTLRHKRHLYSNERRAVAERVYALLRRQRTVDYLLEKTRPQFARLPATRQDLLRLAASRFLQGDGAAQIARESALAPEDADTLGRLPQAQAQLAQLRREERLPISASLPDFLAEKFAQEFGNDAERATAAMNERAPLTVRTNTLKNTREALIQRLQAEGIECEQTPLSPLGLFLNTRINAFSIPAFKDGCFEIQDEGSQLLGALVDPPPTKVVDACAGAGGKTLQLAAQMKNRGEVFALDIDEGRLEELKRRSRRAGVHNVRIRTLPKGPEVDAALADLQRQADRVLVDAPCSGTGTFRRKPDARYRLAAEDLAGYTARQRELLTRFCELVKPGGRLIYGTCSVLREENEDVVSDFLKTHPDFSVRPAAQELGETLGARVTRDGFLRLAPHQHGTDGFFGAILVRARN